MVTTTYTPSGDPLAPTATRLPADEGHRYPRLSARVEGDGSVTTMVRMLDCTRAAAVEGARAKAAVMLQVLAEEVLG